MLSSEELHRRLERIKQKLPKSQSSQQQQQPTRPRPVQQHQNVQVKAQNETKTRLSSEGEKEGGEGISQRTAATNTPVSSFTHRNLLKRDRQKLLTMQLEKEEKRVKMASFRLLLEAVEIDAQSAAAELAVESNILLNIHLK